MKLSELLDIHEGVTLASQKDNKDILDFFQAKQMKGEKFSLHYERSPDFFAFLGFFSPKSFVFISKDQKGNIEGVGTLCLREGYHLGKKTTIGYLGDLRVKPGIKKSLKWRRFFSSLIEHAEKIEEFEKCQIFLTAIIDSNKLATNALVTGKRNSFHYHPICQYNMINLFLALPSFKIKSSKLHCRFATSNDHEIIRDFLKQKNQNRETGYYFCDDDHDELKRRLESWPNFDYSNFILIKKQEEIVGLTALWSPSPVKKIIIDKLPTFQKLFFHVQGVFKDAPKIGKELKVLYLTNLEVHEKYQKEATQKLFHFIQKENIIKNYHCLSFCDYRNNDYAKFIKNFLKIKTPMRVYVVSKHHDLDKLHLPPWFIPGFEMALV